MKRTLQPHLLIPRLTPRLTAFLMTTFLTVALSGCGFNLFNGENIIFGVNPAPLGYQGGADGVTIESRTLTMYSRSGALGANVEGYRVYFFDNNDEPVPVGDSTVYSEGSLGIYVPAGIRCAAPDPDRGCTIHSEGARFEEGYRVSSQPVQLLPGNVALQHVAAGMPIGWYAEVELYGSTDTGANFISKRYQVAVTVPN